MASIGTNFGRNGHPFTSGMGKYLFLRFQSPAPKSNPKTLRQLG
jgi:hypothetical protein